MTTAEEEASSGDLDVPTTARLSRHEIRVVFGGLILGMMLAAIDGTVVTTALPAIVGDLGGLEYLPWVGTVYMLVSTATVPLYGKLSDLYGRRVMFRAAIGIFLVGSILTGMSRSIFELIVFRGLQGLGGGGLMAMGMAIIGEVVSPRERGRYMGYLTPAFFLASVIGPVLGGFFVDNLTWRWIFYINLPLGIAALFVTNHALGILPFSPRRVRLDFEGAALLLGAVTSALLVASWGGRSFAWTSPTILGLGILAVACACAFVRQELRAPEPILPIRLFGNRIFTVVNAVSFFLGAAMMGALVFLPLYLQVVEGSSATDSGLRLVPIICGLMGASVVTGRLITRWGRYKPFCVAGMAAAPVALVVLALLPVGTPFTVYAVALVAMGVCLGMVMPTTMLAVQNGVEHRDLGVATSSVSFSQSLGGTLGLAIFGAIFNARLITEVSNRVGQSGHAAANASRLARSPAQIHGLPPALADKVVDALAAAVQTTFLSAVPLLVAGFVFALLVIELPLKETAHVTGPIGID